ncbi:MAG: hypothetical protein AAF927_10990 [Bacteroidota bacterium]
MKKTNYIIWAVAILLTSILGCKKEYIPPANSDFSDAVAGASGENRIERGNSTSFIDISQGVVNRTWEIPESASIVNLEGKEPAELDIVFVQFDEPGLQTVRLISEFKDSNVKLDTTFEVTVLDYVDASIDVVNIDAGFFEETPTQIEMYEGGIITFADSSAGAPNRRQWFFEGADPAKAGGIDVTEDGLVQSIAVQYPEIGIYDVTLISWRQFPTGEPDTIVLEDYVNVIKNIDPPSIVNITEDEAGIIHLNYNLAMKMSGDLIPNFSLMVDDTMMTITEISINPADNRVIDITPAMDIDHISKVELSYDGNGDLSRVNDVAAEAFMDEVVSLNQPLNLLAMAGIDPSFENGSLAGWDPTIIAANANPITNNSGASVEIVPNGYNSNNAMVVHVNANQDLGVDEKNNFRIHTDYLASPLHFEAGKTYRLEFWYKVEGDGLQEVTARYHQGTGWPPALAGGWTGGASTDWKFRRITWNGPTPDEVLDGRLSLQFISKTNNQSAAVYYDNITLYALD